MLWTLLALTSAFLLGFYDLLKKNSLRENAVIPVLFISSLSGALIFICLFSFSRMTGESTAGMLFVPMVPWKEHVYFFIKSIIVGSSWILAYFAFKHLPITIASPIRASNVIKLRKFFFIVLCVYY